jgi:hypothetical protein
MHATPYSCDHIFSDSYFAYLKPVPDSPHTVDLMLYFFYSVESSHTEFEEQRNQNFPVEASMESTSL